MCFRSTRRCSCVWWRRLWLRLCFTTLTVFYCSHCGEVSLLQSQSHPSCVMDSYSNDWIQFNECVLCLFAGTLPHWRPQHPVTATIITVKRPLRWWTTLSSCPFIWDWALNQDVWIIRMEIDATSYFCNEDTLVCIKAQIIFWLQY